MKRIHYIRGLRGIRARGGRDAFCAWRQCPYPQKRLNPDQMRRLPAIFNCKLQNLVDNDPHPAPFIGETGTSCGRRDDFVDMGYRIGSGNPAFILRTFGKIAVISFAKLLFHIISVVCVYVQKSKYGLHYAKLDRGLLFLLDLKKI